MMNIVSINLYFMVDLKLSSVYFIIICGLYIKIEGVTDNNELTSLFISLLYQIKYRKHRCFGRVILFGFASIYFPHNEPIKLLFTKSLVSRVVSQ